MVRTAAVRRTLVVGGGPAGLATAAALQARGVDAIVFEQATRFGDVGTGLTLWPNALAALATFGAGEPVRAAGLAAEGYEIRTPSGALLEAVSGPTMRARFGGTGMALHRSALVDTLLEQLEPGVVRTGARCVGFRVETHRVVACLSDGTWVSGDALVGADGIRSAVRSQLLGGSDRLRYAGYAVWRAVTRFPIDGAPGLLTMGPGAQFGLFPMLDAQVYWFASLTLPARQAALLDPLPLLNERFGNWHPPIPEVLAATAESEVMVTDIYDRRPLRRWGRGPVTLVGDAAHPSAPTLGQGTCQAFEDAAVLGQRLATADSGEEGLRAYEAARRRRANRVTMQARRLGEVGQWRSPAAVWLREQAMRHVPREPRLRQMERLLAFPLGDAAAD